MSIEEAMTKLAEAKEIGRMLGINSTPEGRAAYRRALEEAKRLAGPGSSLSETVYGLLKTDSKAQP
jgi:hypothetical protein